MDNQKIISKIKINLTWAKQTINQYNKHEQDPELKDAIEDIKSAINLLQELERQNE